VATVSEWPWTAIITAAVSVLVGWLTYLSSRRATKATTRVELSKVDAEAYLRAQKIYDGTIEVLRADNERLTKKIASLEAKIDRLEAAIHDQSAAMRDQTAAIRDQHDDH
jgi:hypothetical protein